MSDVQFVDVFGVGVTASQKSDADDEWSWCDNGDQDVTFSEWLLEWWEAFPQL